MAPYLLTCGAMILLILIAVFLGAYDSKNHRPYYTSTISKITNLSFSGVKELLASRYSKPRKIYVYMRPEDILFARRLTKDSLLKEDFRGLKFHTEVKVKDQKLSTRLDLSETKIINLAHPNRWVYHLAVEDIDDHNDSEHAQNFRLLPAVDDDHLNHYLRSRLLEKRGFDLSGGAYTELIVNGESKGLFYMEKMYRLSVAQLETLGDQGVLFQLDTNLQILRPIAKNRMAVQELENKLNLIRSGNQPLNILFDEKRMGQFYGAWDLAFSTSANPSNWLFYYNPKLGALRPLINIQTDQFDVHKTHFSSLMDEPCFLPETHSDDHPILQQLRNSMLFQEAYIREAGILSKPSFLDQFLDEERYTISRVMKNKGIKAWSLGEDPISIRTLYASAKHIRYLLVPDRVEVSAYTQKITEDRISLQIENHQCLPLEIHSLVVRDSFRCLPEIRYLIKGYDASEGDLYHFHWSEHPSWGDSLIPELAIEYTVIGLDEPKRTALIYPFDRKEYEEMVLNPIAKDATYTHFEFIKDHGNGVLKIPNGRWQIAKDLIIPSQSLLEVESGATIDLLNSAKIISYSPVHFNGNTNKPIFLTSSDSTGMGLIVIGSKELSTLENTQFEKLSNFRTNGYQLTGAVTFYESPVQISSCTFSDNLNGDDFLNIVRAEFSIQRSTFVNVLADAVDADFCQGQIIESEFLGVGNDCIDVSGSTLTVDNVKMRTVGDKGLSAGENSLVEAMDLEIVNAEIALTSKDRSEMIVQRASLHNSKIGIAIYQKKTEFGPARMTAENITIDRSELPFLVEDRSELLLDGQLVSANRKNVRDILYGIEYGKSSKTR